MMHMKQDILLYILFLVLLEKDRVGPSGPVPVSSLLKPEENTVRPRVLSRLKALIEVASETNALTNLIQMAKELLKKLEAIWEGTSSLAFYPAFRCVNLLDHVR